MQNRFTNLLRIGLMLAALHLPARVARCQVLYGTVVGNITDPSNQSIPNATVVATNKQTGMSASVSSNAAGNYEIHNLTPGVYHVQISAPGFASVAVDGLDVRANVTARADERLKITSEQTVEVHASSSELQTDSGVLHGQLSSRELSNLPIGGYGNYQSLINLTPGRPHRAIRMP